VSRRVLPLILLCTIAALAAALTVFLPRPGPTLASGTAAISVGGEHSCVLTASGGVKCWGRNGEGELGNGTTTGPESCTGFPGGFTLSCSTTPIDVTGLASGVTAISAGLHHTCAITTAGGVKCWGANYAGQLGDGTTTDSATPVEVFGLTNGVAAIAAGWSHTCAGLSDGTVKCWGYNADGQLGNGTFSNSSTPVDVTGLSGVASVAGGYSHTCALTTAGGVKCWGRNSAGQLGDGQACGTASCLAPVDATVLSGSVAAIAAGGGHTCAITTAGGLKCWGGNANGELGDGQACGNSWCLAAVDALGLTSGVAAVSAHGTNTCAVTTAGGVKCWGYNGDGQLGNGTFSNSSTPVDVTGLTSGAASVSLGIYFACALETGGAVKCWGWNFLGQLGNGTNIGPQSCFGYPCSSTPLDVVGLGPKPTPTPTDTLTPTPTATRTFTPGPVGGISLDPQLPGSSGPTALALAGVIAGAMAGATALGGGVWYARRRPARRASR
jgi:alpha-tubulin suppressor-like RCC1 family protein